MSLKEIYFILFTAFAALGILFYTAFNVLLNRVRRLAEAGKETEAAGGTALKALKGTTLFLGLIIGFTALYPIMDDGLKWYAVVMIIALLCLTEYSLIRCAARIERGEYFPQEREETAVEKAASGVIRFLIITVCVSAAGAFLLGYLFFSLLPIS
ncbi:MAG: hypothetical protein IKP47_09760 [Ruminococcus sp.]|nr:hypothetical protein [Ruminococcus sp.]